MFCCMLLYVHSSIAINLMGKRELVALLYLFSWCLVMVEWLFPAVPWGCLRFVIVIFPDHSHSLFLDLISIHLHNCKNQCSHLSLGNDVLLYIVCIHLYVCNQEAQHRFDLKQYICICC